MKHSIKFISTVLMLALPLAAHAACDTYMNSDHGVTLPSTITVPDSLPVGGLITRQPFTGVVPDRFITCRTATIISLFGRYPRGTDPLTQAYPTEAPGVGMRISIRDSRPRTNFYSIVSGQQVQASGTYPIFTNAEVYFYKIGPITGGTVPSGSIFDYKMHNGGGVFPGRFILRLNNSVRFVRLAATCDLAAGDVNRTITFAPIKTSDLKDIDYAGMQGFDLTANCTNATNVTFRFSGTPATGNNLLFANSGTANGVALWMGSNLNGVQQTISPNANNVRTVPVSGNRAVLPMLAAYHKNGTVGAGTLVSNATVNITYN